MESTTGVLSMHTRSKIRWIVIFIAISISGMAVGTIADAIGIVDPKTGDYIFLGSAAAGVIAILALGIFFPIRLQDENRDTPARANED